jgi:hypothetical protein
MKPRLKIILFPCVYRNGRNPQKISQCLSAECVSESAEDLITLGICFSELLNCMEHGSRHKNSIPCLGQMALYRWMSNAFLPPNLDTPSLAKFIRASELINYFYF